MYLRELIKPAPKPCRVHKEVKAKVEKTLKKVKKVLDKPPLICYNSYRG
jgi:hypothetical protein